MLTPGEGVLVEVHVRGRVLPRAAADARAVPAQTAAAVRPRQRGRRRRAQRARRAPPSRRATAWPPSARSAASPRRPSRPSSSPSRCARARLRAGRGADPQLPHRLLLARAARAPEAGRDRARPRRRRRCRAPPRCRSPGRSARARSRSSPARRRREVAEQAGADHVVLAGEGWKDEVKELSGGGVDVVLDPVGGDRFTDSLRSLREDGRLRRRRLHRRLDPRGQGQPPAAAATPRSWAPAGAPT